MWISPQFHLKVVHVFDTLQTQGVTVADHAAEKPSTIHGGNPESIQEATVECGAMIDEIFRCSILSNAITKEFQGNVFQFREDGYFNMTAAAKTFGKGVDNFLRLDETKVYMHSLTEVLNHSHLRNLKIIATG